MATHIHQSAAAGLVEIIKPIAVRTRMLLALPHVEDFPDRVFLDEFAHPLVLGRETQLLGIHEFAVGGFHGGDHVVGFFEGEAQWLLDDDVFAGFRGRHHRAMVQDIGQANVHHIASGLGDCFLEAGEGFRDAMLLRKGLCPFASARIDRDDLCFRDKSVI